MIRQDCVKIKICTEAAGHAELDCSNCHHYAPNPSSPNGINSKKDKSMQNNLAGLNDALFQQLNRLGKDDLTGDALVGEVSRAQAIRDISVQIINNSALALKAHMAINTGMSKKTPKMLTE